MEAQSTLQPQPSQARATQPAADPNAGLRTGLSPLELESLAINLESSMKVRASHHLFNWTQGSLQSLVRHDLLVCALCNGEPMSFHIESFSTASLDLTRFNEMFRQDVTLMANVVKAWEENHRQPLVREAAADSPFAGTAIGRELGRIGAARVVTHGTYDACGKLSSLFLFACGQDVPGQKQAYLVELLVPFLHTAWVRTQVRWPSANSGTKPAVTGLLTPREVEILKWLYHGKSNVEIGIILAISPLTVKNHVQKILRKLDVLNRTQAIGKALALRVLNI